MKKNIKDADIAFSDYTKDDIHGTVLYPAVMVAPVQRAILEQLYNEHPFSSVLDPFVGSGTALYESASVAPDAALWGCDINPLACLITDVKLHGVSRRISDSLNELKMALLTREEVQALSFSGIHKWFDEAVIRKLSLIRHAVAQVSIRKDRLFFWLIMCDVIRKFCNSRTSTYKLHVRPVGARRGSAENVIPLFIKSCEDNMTHFFRSYKHVHVKKGDILDALRMRELPKFDLVVTSPPYGDNATTVPYGEFSSLALRWIVPQDLKLQGWELDNYSIIDSRSLGGSRVAGKRTVLMDEECILIKDILQNVTPRKIGKVRNFFCDYFDFLSMVADRCSRYMVMTLGNRTVDRYQINLTDITRKYLENLGFTHRDTFRRRILRKRTPRLTSSVCNEAVPSMNEEFILIMECKA